MYIKRKKYKMLLIGVLLIFVEICLGPVCVSNAANDNGYLSAEWEGPRRCAVKNGNEMCVQPWEVDGAQFYKDIYYKNTGGSTNALFALEALGKVTFYGKTVYVEKVSTHMDDFWTGFYNKVSVYGKLVSPGSKSLLDISGELYLSW
jgi:hypothetical protein